MAHRSNVLSALALGLLLPVGVLSHAGCSKDEPPPPMQSASCPDTPAAPLVLEPEADVKKVGLAPASSMQACCAALRQNAASAPPPANMQMMTAAAACYAAVAEGQNGSSITSIVSGALRGAGMPAVCGSPSSPPKRRPPRRGSGSSV